MTDFPPVAANFVPLSPLSFLARTAAVFADRTAVVYGQRRYSWAQVQDRAARLAGALKALGVGKGHVVSVIATNTPEMIEAHYGVPWSGATLNAINVRLEPETLAYILDHAETKVLITDTAFAPSVKAALHLAENKSLRVIDICDSEAVGETLGEQDYEAFLAAATPAPFALPVDEWDNLALNYTSGTSGRPKGVLYHHRGAYLMAMGTIPCWGVSLHPRYLYCVPLFHCNGWNHVWAMTILAGTIYCIRDLSPANIWRQIDRNQISHFGAAPIILGNLVNAPSQDVYPLGRTIEVVTAGAPPPAAILAACAQLGMNVVQVYGLTETYGHTVVCQPQDHWAELEAEPLAALKARQGVAFPMTEDVRVVDVVSREDVPADGVSEGEILIRGNTVMKGYFKNPEATAAAFADGAFRSGDVAVKHPDGYIEIRDRLKDVIISGGENISSVEVEGILYTHACVAAAAVVAMPDPKWGEVPCAFIELKDGMTPPDPDLMREWCRARMAGFKTPKRFEFQALPKTATGKIQKFELRKIAANLG